MSLCNTQMHTCDVFHQSPTSPKHQFCTRGLLYDIFSRNNITSKNWDPDKSTPIREAGSCLSLTSLPQEELPPSLLKHLCWGPEMAHPEEGPCCEEAQVKPAHRGHRERPPILYIDRDESSASRCSCHPLF